MSQSPWSFKGEEREQASNEELSFVSAYTGISDYDQLRSRLDEVQREAEATLHVYRCVARQAFLKPRINDFPTYKSLPNTSRVLEIGCCFGTEIRGMIQDGFSPDRLIAVDVTDGYWKLGQKLYGDQPQGVRTEFCDMAVDTISELQDILGTMDMVVAIAVFHVLSEKQVGLMLKQIHKLLAPGGRLVAFSAGSSTAGPWRTGGSGNQSTESQRYLHSIESMTALLQTTGFSDTNVREHGTRTRLDPRDQDKMKDIVGNADLRMLIEASKPAPSTS